MNTTLTPISVAIEMAGSQKKLASLIGVHQTAISHFFVGRKRPSPEIAMRLQNAVNNKFKWYEFIKQGESSGMETQPHGTECQDSTTGAAARNDNSAD